MGSCLVSSSTEIVGQKGSESFAHHLRVLHREAPVQLLKPLPARRTASACDSLRARYRGRFPPVEEVGLARCLSPPRQGLSRRARVVAAMARLVSRVRRDPTPSPHALEKFLRVHDRIQCGSHARRSCRRALGEPYELAAGGQSGPGFRRRPRAKDAESAALLPSCSEVSPSFLDVQTIGIEGIQLYLHHEALEVGDAGTRDRSDGKPHYDAFLFARLALRRGDLLFRLRSRT